MLRSPYSNYLKGDTYGTVYAYRYAGLTETGDPSVYDENGEVKSNTSVEDIQALVAKGQLAPKWNGALTVNLRWKLSLIHIFSSVMLPLMLSMALSGA